MAFGIGQVSFSRVVKKALEERLVHLIDRLKTGTLDQVEYARTCGWIAATEDTLHLILELEKEANS
jgi:hypothetical protein